MKDPFFTGRTDWISGSDLVRQGEVAAGVPLQPCMPFSGLTCADQPRMHTSR